MTDDWSLAVAVVACWIAIQYGLCVWAFRDLRRRRVTAYGNRVSWLLVILCVPVIGPLLYLQVARPVGGAARRRAIASSRSPSANDPEASDPWLASGWDWIDDEPLDAPSRR